MTHFGAAPLCYRLLLTALIADPHALLRTVMFCGFTDQLNCPLYLPSPRLRRVPIICSDDDTYTRRVAPELLLRAAIRNSSLFPE